MDFIGRTGELSDLEKIYSEGGSAVMVYGRRRIGKTTLLERFCEGKRNIFFRCLKDSESSNIAYFSKRLSLFLGKETHADSFMDFVDVLENCIQEKTAIVIDEYPYISSSSVSSLLQHFIDGPLKRSDSMLILCGSSISVMKDQGFNQSNPLYGRFKRMMHVQPMSFEEIRLFHPGMSEMDSLKLYLTVGGVPKYHIEMDSDTFEDCIKKNYLESDWMMDETERLTESELPSPRRALAILSAIGGGATSLSEISQKVGVDATLCFKCISMLMEIGLVSKVKPMFDAPKRPSYRLSDGLFSFHYEVIQGMTAYLTPGHSDEAYELLKQKIDTFLGRRFEFFCMEFITKEYLTVETGTWWMDKGDIHSEIDIISKVSSKRITYELFCECKFRNSPMGYRNYNLLLERSKRFANVTNPRYLLFSISGFEPRLEELAAEDDSVILIGPEEIFGHRGIKAL